MKPSESLAKKTIGSAESAGKKVGRASATFVVCLENPGFPVSLELHKIYRVIPDAVAELDGDLRILDQTGEDYLYPAAWFAGIDVPLEIRKSLLAAH